MDMRTKKSALRASSGAAALRRSGATDAIVMLREDHARVTSLFAKYPKLIDKGPEEDKQGLVQTIVGELKIHTTLEEEIFYPAAREAFKDRKDDGDALLDEAEVEHASAKDLIARLEGTSPDDDLYDAKVTVLGEYIKHHVKEEQDELFPQCRKAKMDLKAIGAAMMARKKDLG